MSLPLNPNPSIEQEYFPHDTYLKSWILFLLMTGLIGWGLWLTYYPRPLPTLTPVFARSEGTDWFLILHLPEVPQDPSLSDQAEYRFGQWLAALEHAGYHPLLLTDVSQRLQQGVGLPRKTVVLLFDPGHYHTFQTIAPVLMNYHAPAVWLTDHTALVRGDKHFINRNTVRTMNRTGFWDVGFFGDGFWGHSRPLEEWKIGDTLKAQWAVSAGHSALNWHNSFAALNRLDVSPKWNADDLLNRLSLEIPIQGPVHLGVKYVQNRPWGVVSDAPHQDNRFTMKATLRGHSDGIYWLSTRGLQDMIVNLNIPTHFGEVFLWLRSDKNAGEGVGIGFDHTRLRVDQLIQGRRVHLKSVAWTGTKAQRPISLHVVLSGNQLELTAPAVEPLHIPLQPRPRSSEAMIRLSLYDHISGAARADNIDLIVSPPASSKKIDQPTKLPQ